MAKLCIGSQPYSVVLSNRVFAEDGSKLCRIRDKAGARIRRGCNRRRTAVFVRQFDFISWPDVPEDRFPGCPGKCQDQVFVACAGNITK